MSLRKITLSTLCATGLLAGCGGVDPVYTQFTDPAGDLIATSGWATAHNQKVMTEGQYFGIELSRRFASEVETTVTFALNSATLDGSARDILREQAAWIAQFPELRFRVYGHTDLTGPSAKNKSLGMKRALAVVDFFETQGISRARLEAAISLGEEQPLIATQKRERRNRRTVTEVSGFYEPHKNVIDGKYAAIAYRAYSRSGGS